MLWGTLSFDGGGEDEVEGVSLKWRDWPSSPWA
jgi:hypothetical protein